MESFEGQGDSRQSPDNERGDNVQTTGEHDQDPGPGPPSSGASERLVPEESYSRDQQPWGQSRGDENRGWMQRIRRRRRRRAALSGHLLDTEDNVPPWLPPHDITPYTARNIRDAACRAVKQSHLQALSNLILDSGLDTQHILCFVMAARQRLQDIRRGPLVANLLQTEENLLDFVRFMGVMSSCNNPAVNYWFHKTIGNFKPYYPWNAPPNENPYHARRGIKEHVIQNAFRKAQIQGLSMLATGGEPRGDATSETSSDEDTGRQGSDVELESSDDELPYIDPNMEPVQQRPVMFVSRVPAKKPRKLPWPTPKTHPVKRTNVKTSDRSDKAEAQSTPERPGPSEQSSVTVEPAHPTPVEMPMVILHQPPPVPKPVPVKPTPPPSRRRRGACVVYDDDVIEVIDVETTEDSSSVSQPNKPHRKHQDGFQRSGRRQKRAAPPTVSPSDTGPPAVGPPAAGPPAAGPPAAGPPAAGPPAAGPPAAGPRILAPLSAGPPAAGPHIVTPPSARPRIMAPPVVRMFMRERQLPQSTGRKPQCFWEMRAGREITQMQQEPSSHLQSATQPTTPRPSWAPSVCALSVMDAGKAQPIESSHLSSMSPTQPISHEEQPRYEDPDAPLDLSLHPDVAAQPAPQAPYQGYQEPPAPQAPYQGYQEPPPPQAPYQGYQEPPAHGLQSSSYPGYAGPWTPRSQHPCYRHPWAPWSQDPVHGHTQGPWDPRAPHLPPQWDGSAGHGQDQVSQFPHLQSETGPPRLQLSLVPLVSSSAPSWSSPQPRAPIRPIPTRFPPPPMPLQDSMAVGCDSSGTACPSMPFASDYSQGAFTPLDINATTPKRPRVEESSHGPARCSQATAEAQEILSDNSEISVFPKDAKQTDYDASTESELD
ncbi:EBNA3C latent protein [human gammaherpesvirus 4]|uniref:EBNA3C latent protein n=1 Tax=Epstein-Barr virus (strain GD1) TaxID=10376 RepID=A0A0B6VKC9_EBVG|nr:EBNA3C latent protein [human gammaherpesvirus 4]